MIRMEVYQDHLYTIINQPYPTPKAELIKLLKSISIKYNTRIVHYTIMNDKLEYEMPGDELMQPTDLIQYIGMLGLGDKIKYSLKMLILDKGQTLDTIHQQGYEEGVKKGLKLNREGGYNKGIQEGLLLMNKLEKPGIPVPKQLREYIYTRDKGKCQCCGKKLTYGTKECTIDHIIPRELGGSSLDTRNLQLLCFHCNSVKGSRVLSNTQLRREVHEEQN